VRRRAEAGLLLNTIVWGATFVLVKSALADISPMLFLAFRFGLAAIALCAIFRASLLRKFSWSAARAGAISGTFLFAGFALQTVGLRLTTPPKSAFLTGLTSVIVPLLAAAVYKIRPQIVELAGVAAAMAGLALMTLEGAAASIQTGDLLTIFCAVGFAAYIVSAAHFSESMPFEVLTVTQVGAAAIWSAGLFWWTETPRVAWRPAVVAGILITGLLATALAFAIQAWALQHTTANRTAVIYMFEPVVAWATSFLMAGEGLSARGTGGAALILLGIGLVEMKPFGLRQHPSK
jgi:drug/metabolite transporter (DMT)-like permease